MAPALDGADLRPIHEHDVEYIMVAVYMMYMIRKQLYLREDQDKALKRRAKALGITEAELVRAALDATLFEQPAVPDARRFRALAHLWTLLDALPKGQRVRWSRDELYAEREGRFGGHG